MQTDMESLLGLSNLFQFTLLAFLFWWFVNAAQVWVGGEAFERRIAGLRGNLFESYRQGIGHRLNVLSNWLGDDRSEGPQYLSGGAFLLCWGLASFYPMLFVLVGWSLLGGSGSFAGLQLFSPDADQQSRLVILLATVGPVTVVAGLASLKFFRDRPFILFLVAFAGAFAGAVAGAVAFAGAFAGAVAVAGAVAFAVAVAVAFAVAVAVAVAVADRRGRGWQVALLFLALLVLVPLALAWAGGTGLIPPLDETRRNLPFGAGGVVLFLALLPVLNTPFDWVSLGITRWLLAGLAKLGEQGGFVQRALNWSGSVAVIAIDGVLAVLLSIAVVVATAGGTALFSEMHVLCGGKPLYDVPGLVAQVRADPLNADWWWIYFMIFSTLIPTFIHFIVYAGMIGTKWVVGFFNVLFGPQSIADWIVRAHERKGAAVLGPALFLSVLSFAPVIGLAWLLLELPLILQSLMPWFDLTTFGNSLADLAIETARLVERLI